jgi:hypothetical protein
MMLHDRNLSMHYLYFLTSHSVLTAAHLGFGPTTPLHWNSFHKLLTELNTEVVQAMGFLLWPLHIQGQVHTRNWIHYCCSCWAIYSTDCSCVGN